MPHTVTALFKDHAQAQQALQSLIEMGIAQSDIKAMGFNESREVSSISGFRTLSVRDDALATLKDLTLPEADRRIFEQGLQRGFVLVAARIDRDNLDEAVRILEMFDPVNLDHGSREWARSADTPEAQADVGGPLGAGMTGGNTGGLTNTDALPGARAMIEGTDELGTAEMRTEDPDSVAPTGEPRDDERAELPGVGEVAHPSPAPEPGAGPFQRHMGRGNLVWVYLWDDRGSPPS
jgi:hypothetical protein